MALDIRGSLKNTKINSSKYIFIDELLTNAIDSYLIRKNNDEVFVDPLLVQFNINFHKKNLIGNEVNFEISCTDNGAGFNDDQVKAFITKDTSYKDDLAIEGIGKCRGSGRIQFLHFFSKVNIESIFQSNNSFRSRSLNIGSDAKEISTSSFHTKNINKTDLKTTITLDVMNPEVYERFYSKINVMEDFSVESLKNHLIVNFLQKFVSLKESLGNFSIKFTTKCDDQDEFSFFEKEDLPNITQKKDINIFYLNSEGEKIEKSELFLLSHYKLTKKQYGLKSNTVAMCARSATVKNITNKYLRTKTIENNDINGFYHIILIESEYLDEYVNTQRDGFSIPKKNQQDDTFLQNMISFEQIYEGIEEAVCEMIAPPDWNKEKIVRSIKKKYGVSSSMIAETNVRIHYGHTEENIVKRVLKTYQERIIKDTSDIFDIKEEIFKSDPNNNDFRKKVDEFSWKYTSSLKSIDMANLSQVVVRRAAMIEILDYAVNKTLNVQIENDGRRCDEKLIHNIFFPMGKDSSEMQDHDVWILNEEYHYYDYISSDQSLSKVMWDDDSLLFEADIDDEMHKIFNKNYDDNKGKRPDIALFTKEGSAIIVEFKSPGVSLDDHTGDLMEYAQLIAAKSKGRIKKFYGYLIGDEINENRIRGYKRFSSGKGWFGTEPITEHSTGKILGELYSEILFYTDIVDRANIRLDIYREKLGIDFKSEED
ncbi:MAG: hypothetical protein ACJAS6_000246 [Rickettsiales bacterium]|jgi:hypothetical protein